MAPTDSRGPFAVDRRERIMRQLRSHGSVVVTDLAVELGVSTMTIRRDINTLASRGLLLRTHGGATLPGTLGVIESSDDTAQNLRRSRFTVGLVVPQLEYYFPEVVAGAREAATQAQVRLVIRTTGYSSDEDRHQIRRLAETAGIDGLIVAPDLRGARGTELLDWLDRAPLPVVLAERRPPSINPFRSLEWVASDHASGAATAVWHLHDQGHRRIGLLTLGRTNSSEQLQHGWRDALTTLSISPEDQLLGYTDGFSVPNRAEHLDHALRAIADTGTTAVVVHSDPFALTFAQYCAEMGVSVPNDLAIVAYDDEVAELGEPPLTAVRPPKVDVGRIAVETMVARLVSGARRPAHRVAVEPTLHIRESSVRTTSRT